MNFQYYTISIPIGVTSTSPPGEDFKFIVKPSHSDDTWIEAENAQEHINFTPNTLKCFEELEAKKGILRASMATVYFQWLAITLFTTLQVFSPDPADLFSAQGWSKTFMLNRIKYFIIIEWGFLRDLNSPPASAMSAPPLCPLVRAREDWNDELVTPLNEANRITDLHNNHNVEQQQSTSVDLAFGEANQLDDYKFIALSLMSLNRNLGWKRSENSSKHSAPISDVNTLPATFSWLLKLFSNRTTNSNRVALESANFFFSVSLFTCTLQFQLISYAFH